MAAALPCLYQGSVKNILGPVPHSPEMLIFQFSDAFSAFDWGRMPDAIPCKGQALAVVSAELFTLIAQGKTWKDFSRSQTALELRKGVATIPGMYDSKNLPAGVTPPDSLSSIFNELGESLQQRGMGSHYLGVANDPQQKPQPLSDMAAPFNCMAVKRVNVVRPTLNPLMGKPVLDYSTTRSAAAPKLIPLEVVFRFSCPSGSSLLKVLQRDPHYLTSLGLPSEMASSLADKGADHQPVTWTYPVVELFTKLESKDRRLSYTEALAISGLRSEQLQRVILQTVWLAGFFKDRCLSAGLELADGKFEWGLDHEGQIILVDSVGPDEFRILYQGQQLSKEFLRRWYRKTPWHSKLENAQAMNVADWKRRLGEDPPRLPPNYLEAASQVYQVLTNKLSQRTWFKSAWTLEELSQRVRKLESGGS